MKRQMFYTGLFVFLLFFCKNTRAQVISSKQIDSVAELTLKTFDVPGIAVAVIKDGKLVHAKGYGVRSLKNMLKVDENTLFGIASNSKAFTAAALGMLVDEGKIKWDDKVTDYIPEFKLYNPYVTDEFTIRDLLTHRSGMGLGAGDLMMFPDSSDFTKKDIIHNLRYLKQVSGFRTKYDYDNNLYIVAGEIVAKVSGSSWEAFVENRIMKPLNMNSSATSLSRLKDKSNAISPHAPVDGTVQAINMDWSETANAAGGIWSNLTDYSKWLIALMEKGKYGDGLNKKLFSDAVSEELWTPQTIVPVRTSAPYNSHFAAYGLGFFLRDLKGYKHVSHTGGLAGIVTQEIMLPELKLGIIVFTNQQSGAAFTAVSNTIMDSYLGIKDMNWVKMLHDRVAAGEAQAKKITDDVWKEIAAQQKKTEGRIDVSLFTGTYHDAWFGDIEVLVKDGKTWFQSKRSPKLHGEVLPYKGSTFIVKWNDRSMDADAFMLFSTDAEGKASGLKMKAISPLTDFSYDFHDLDFVKVK